MGNAPSAMFTPRTSSSIVSVRSWLQSPMQAIGAAAATGTRSTPIEATQHSSAAAPTASGEANIDRTWNRI